MARRKNRWFGFLGYGFGTLVFCAIICVALYGPVKNYIFFHTIRTTSFIDEDKKIRPENYEDLKRITVLSINCKNLRWYSSNLSSLPSLKKLKLSNFTEFWDEPVSDYHVSLLGQLTQLEELDLYNSNVQDLSPLSDLTELRTLNLERSKVTDITPLSNLTKLKKLDLDFTDVADLSPLKKAVALEFLHLGGTNVRDLEPINGLTRLKELNIKGTKVNDLLPLRDSTGLISLYVSYTAISDLSPLDNLPNLSWVESIDSKVSQKDLQDWQKRNPNCELSY